MSDTVIRVENLGKKYSLGSKQEGERYTALRDVVANRAKEIARQFKAPYLKSHPVDPEEFWALKDVSFEIKQGDRVGIIGRNGAGKSTLLKILSRITEPTEGRIKIRGRVASLLEVGTGFHPELTGRENIYLNGTILGMSKAEIRRKFDEIVAFSEVEKFLDTPVKRYSSGMYVRLAFAVAAHLEPEVLVVDEVLAVGDAQFQKKCIGKMSDISREGRTVIFVSHNMAAIQKLCSKGIILDKGSLTIQGSPDQCVIEYLKSRDHISRDGSFYAIDRNLLNRPNKGISISNVRLLSPSSEGNNFIRTTDSLHIRISYKADPTFAKESISFVIKLKSHFGQEIIRLSTTPISGYSIKGLGRTGQVELKIDNLPLTSGRYFLDLEVARPNIEYLLQLQELVAIEIDEKDVYGSGIALDQTRGILVVPHHWSHSIDTYPSEVVQNATIS